MGIRWTGSRGQVERLSRRQSRQQRENQTEAESQRQIGESERPKTVWTKLALWWREWVAEVFPKFARVIGVAVIFVFGLYLVAAAFYGWRDYQNGRDNKGEIEHHHDTPVWIQGNWIVGEYRDCQMRTKTVPPNRKDLDSVDKLPRLFCAGDKNGLFDFQTTVVTPPPDIKAPPEGTMYLIGVTAADLDHDFHVMPVRFDGRIDRTDKWVISWRCQRLSMGFLESAAIECKALD